MTLWRALLFKAKSPEVSQRAAARRLVRWRNRVWRHLSAVPIGALVSGAVAAACHLWGAHFPALCGWFSKLTR